MRKSSSLSQEIERWGVATDLNTIFEISPFEIPNNLAQRDYYLEEKIDEMTEEEKERLHCYDQRIWDNRQELLKYMGALYDTPKSKPQSHWWWYLDEF